MYRKSYCITPGVGSGVGIGISTMLKFYVNTVFFCMMGKVPKGKLSCLWTGLVIQLAQIPCISIVQVIKLTPKFKVIGGLPLE